ncbi:DUF192 domain-containing protein [Pseudoalteromonas sp. TB64]|uniref:DUF192 domain-containing protein n=1 Tax=Pseudoalteromonas sp. TB64 TaxID=1938600 RepID=UPI000464287F|nr:DUF192 domain-containing protein [Pseudoalteromonas sp. TB64]
MNKLTLIKNKNSFNIFHANTWLLRLRGLLGRKLNINEGMLIEPCNSIHTFWMQYDLDIVFLNKENKIIKIVENIKPWRLSACNKANKTLEFPSGTLSTSNFKEGDLLIFQKVNHR